MVTLLGEAALRTLFLAACVQLGLMLLRVRRPLLHLMAWSVVLAASLLMPAMQWAVPVQLAVLPNVHDVVLTEVASVSWQAAVGPVTAQGSAEGLAVPTMPVAWLAALYLLVTGILLVRLTVGIALALQLLSRAAPVQPDWGGTTRIRVSSDIMAPVTVANVILLPSDAVGWSIPMRDAVLAHERAHIARWDFAMLLAAQLNQAIFWFSPFSWWLRHRLAMLAELASDDQAVAVTGDGLGYAEVLLEMGRRSGSLLRGVAMARPVMLAHRIERVLSERAARASPSSLQRLMLTTSVAGLSTMVAMSRPVPPPMPDPSPTIALALVVEPMQPTTSLDRISVPLERATSEPMLAASTGIAIQEAPRHSAVGPPTSPPNLLVGGSQTGTREATKYRSPTLPARPTVQQARVVRTSSSNAVLSSGKVTAAILLPRSNEGPSPAGSALAAVQEGRTALPSGRAPDAELHAPKRGNEPSCTGAYLPKSGNSRLDGQADLIQTNYFQASDGTPWLRLLFGSRIQMRLNGYDVERTSVRATVVTAVPKDASRIAGSSQGVFGTVDYECVRPATRL